MKRLRMERIELAGTKAMKRRKLGLLVSVTIIVFLGLLPVGTNAAEKQRVQTILLDGSEAKAFLDIAFADQRVQALQSFLQNRGYKADTAQAKVLRSDFDGKKAVTVGLIPFATDNGTFGARVAFWDGNWQGRDDRDAVAILGETEVYVMKGKGVALVSKPDFVKQLRIPLLQTLGYSEEGPVARSSSIGIKALCTSTDRYRRGYTLLGFTAWEFHQTKNWCYGSSVSNVSVGVYVTNMDPNFYYRGVVNQWDRFTTNNATHDSMRQAQIDNCVFKYGCIGTVYPAIEIWANKDGSSTATSWQ